MTTDNSSSKIAIPAVTVAVDSMDTLPTNLMAWRTQKEIDGSIRPNEVIFPRRFEGYSTLWKYEIGPGVTVRGKTKADPSKSFEGLILEATHDLDTERVRIVWDTGESDKAAITIVSYDELTELVTSAPVGTLAEPSRTETIALLNDSLRAKLKFNSPCLSTTMGVMGLGKEELPIIVERIANHEGFSNGENPFDERDFGIFELTTGSGKDSATYKIAWKIDCYDNNLELNSPNPADPALTCRIITVSIEGEAS